MVPFLSHASPRAIFLIMVSWLLTLAPGVRGQPGSDVIDPACTPAQKAAIVLALAESLEILNVVILFAQKFGKKKIPPPNEDMLYWFLFKGGTDKDKTISDAFTQVLNIHEGGLTGVRIRCDDANQYQRVTVNQNDMPQYEAQAQTLGLDLPYFWLVRDLLAVWIQHGDPNHKYGGVYTSTDGHKTFNPAWSYTFLNPPPPMSNIIYVEGESETNTPGCGSVGPSAFTLRNEIVVCPTLFTELFTLLPTTFPTGTYLDNENAGTSTLSTILLHESFHLDLYKIDILSPAHPSEFDNQFPDPNGQDGALTVGYQFINCVYMCLDDIENNLDRCFVNPDTYATYAKAVFLGQRLNIDWGHPQALGCAVPKGNPATIQPLGVGIVDVPAGWAGELNTIVDKVRSIAEDGKLPKNLLSYFNDVYPPIKGPEQNLQDLFCCSTCGQCVIL